MTEEAAQYQNFSNIYKDVADLRNLPVSDIPKQHKITVEQIRKEARGSMDAETLTAMEQEELLLDILDVVPDDFDYSDRWADLFSEAVAGYYTPSENEIYLVNGMCSAPRT